MKNYKQFISERKIEKLNYYAFDFDDNILHMPTIIHMDKLNNGKWEPISLTPEQFASLRHNSDYRIRDNNPQKAYEEFRDVGPREKEAFIEDIKSAVNQKTFGPSWNKFVECLTHGSLFAIVTARGHESSTIKEGIKWLIDSCLTDKEKNKMYLSCETFSHVFNKEIFERNYNIKFSDNQLIKYYLDRCKFYGVGSSESFKQEFNLPDTTTIEEAKKIAISKFLEICNSYGKKANVKVSVGFSDDDKHNVEHVKRFFEFKSAIYNNMKLHVYDTSNKGSVKTTYESSMDGKDASILRFTGFNTLPNDLGNTTTDFSQPNYTLLQKAKVANKLTKDITNKKFNKKLKNVKRSKRNNNTK